MTVELSQAEVFPLIRSGGLFLIAAGASIVIGAFRFRARYVILAGSAAIGAVLTSLFAAALAGPFGPVRLIEVLSLAIAVATETVLLISALRRPWAHDEREATLTILTIVGGHFLLMAPAFGPLIVALAGTSVLNTLLGLSWRGYPITWLWGLDGALKTSVGALMFLGHQLPCTGCLAWPDL